MLSVWSIARPITASMVAVTEAKDLLKTCLLFFCFPFLVAYDYFNQQPHGVHSIH